ncbi:Citrinin biosynthesis cluster MFS transporter mrr1 [Colletotrichum gloeosporioides]|uniref:Citrinin biosynthesis cluster MFS transporter mrr1 n=1 Tax=Colletotrichum gloeosporioides TaxID=474922 RepID=A0A8H4CL80_COLGL|nr:Citrinin biosynthesis cluster MFS transporter mrr1 [Colletotrichum gloeosporioides]KAF3806023.1 Citrinin biosynthesis cluster MFS transporter mrr1 [Colletotrichum gloeosporioides]
MSVPDPEKGSHAAETATTTSSGQDSPQLRPLKTVQSRHSHRSRALSTSSTDTDPLEPLSHALTPDLETEVEHAAREPITYTRTGTSIGSTASRPPDFEVTFEPGDPENPKNWPLWYRAWTIFVVSFSTWVIVLYSTSYTASIPGLVIEYESSQVIATLGVTTYLLGLAAGSLIVAPMSELYGRQYVYVVCFIISALLIIPCGLAKSLTTLIVVRFFGALFGAALIANSPGTVVDIADEEYRALAMSFYSIAPLNGPVTGPLIGGFVFQYLGWRWTNWVVLIIAGFAICLMFTLKETYAPTILQRKAARIRKETDDPRWWCRYDEKVSKLHLIKLNLSRPFVLSFTEPILWFFNIWISLIYGILYLCFVAYPIVFSQHRGWGPGTSGLAFLGIGVGTIAAILSEPLFRRIINAHPKDPVTGRVPPEATARVMTIGAILTPIGQLVFSWTCLPKTIHWAVPIAFGIPFGAGNTISFIYGSNYLAGAYGIYAASALAGNAVMRSMFGGTLPLAGASMYRALTPQWAGTLCGLLELALIPIPIIFWRYGERIRAKSPVIKQMREDQEKNESKRAKALARLARKKEREAAGAADGEKTTGVLEEQTQARDFEQETGSGKA